jgi:glycolate oxidase FAD binding subunit
VTTLAPRNADEVAEAVRWAMNAGEALEVIGTGTRREIGRPVDAPHVLDVGAVRGVLEYEPEELVLTALPGTSLAEIESLLATHKQCLAFEPPYLTGSAGTLGGAVSTGFSGPRRLKAGAVRDHVLGVTAVSGRGELFKAGGKVVKNVTGYDLPKLITGSYGTLAVITELTLKVLPAPEDTRTLIVAGQTAADAVRTMTSVLQSTADASAACYLPQDVSTPGADVPLTSGVAGDVAAARFSTGSASTAFRLEGVSPSVEFRLSRLHALLASAGPVSVLDRAASLDFWRAIRDVTPLSRDPACSLWRISVPPAQGAEALARLLASVPDARAFLDWGGGLMWLQAPDAGANANANAQAVRAALAQSGGHATLVRAPGEVRRALDVFQPQTDALAALSARVKQQFDPQRVLNPGRMYAGV